ncbi:MULTISPECIES: 2-amino-4-hydroxy-6-hydroxymethyldihydropteridine diphosphokinase [Aphanothece]|uniref:2-amino-4-hydroxy-6- hydroxymethyldihydropteridine diphosphokinase n=1 Tax=Aphanothece TaxID=1121 RepID=UPI00398541DC
MREGAGATTTAIALGANLPGPAGPPRTTLVSVRPWLESLLHRRGWRGLQWSPLFRTAPVGGPAGQPDYLNAVLLAWQTPQADPQELLVELQSLEDRFGRQRQEPWGPRSLDLDLLWCGAATVRSTALELPHPRLMERAFVLAPLDAIAPALVPPGSERPVGVLLEALLCAGGAGPRGGGGAAAVLRLPGEPGWPE